MHQHLTVTSSASPTWQRSKPLASLWSVHWSTLWVPTLSNVIGSRKENINQEGSYKHSPWLQRAYAQLERLGMLFFLSDFMSPLLWSIFFLMFHIADKLNISFSFFKSWPGNKCITFQSRPKVLLCLRGSRGQNILALKLIETVTALQIKPRSSIWEARA